jgi:hypothetical protein
VRVVRQRAGPRCKILQRMRRGSREDLAAVGSIRIVLATTVLAGALPRRRTDSDLDAANVAIDRLAAAPTEPGYVINDIAVLRLRRCWRRHTETTRNTKTFATATGRERQRSASTDMSPWPRPWCDLAC